jgi:hypothetical protein
MPSSVIKSFDYDETRNELTVALTTGRVYVYALVPPPVAGGFKAAFSKGRFFNERIRDKFPYRELKGGVAGEVRRA